MKAIGDHARVDEVAGQGIKPRDLWLRGVKGCVEDADLNGAREVRGRSLDAAQIVRLVQRCKRRERLQALQDVVA